MKQFGWIVIVGLFTSLVGCSSESTDTNVLPTTPVVKTQALNVHEQLPDWTLTGVVTARYQTPLAFRVTGKITERLVNDGDTVQAGQELFKLDPTDFELSLNVSLANMRSTESEITNAKLELNRLQKLFKRNLTSEQNVDQASNALTVLQERFKSQSLQEKQTRNQLAYTHLKSPGLGKISAVLAEKGQVINAGTPALTWIQNGHREVNVQVPESRLATLPKTAQWLFAKDQMVEVTLREVAQQADFNSRTWSAYYVLPETAQFILGQTARLIFAATDTQIKVPNTAIYDQGQVTAIFCPWWTARSIACRSRCCSCQIVRLGLREILVALKKLLPLVCINYKMARRCGSRRNDAF